MYCPLTVACIFFLARFEFVFIFLDGNPPRDQKAIQATGKLIQEITKALVVNKIGPYICLISKSAPIYQVTLELLPLYRAGKKKTKQIWEDNITPIQINLLPQNKRLEERSAQHISAVLTWLYHKNLCQARCIARNINQSK